MTPISCRLVIYISSALYFTGSSTIRHGYWKAEPLHVIGRRNNGGQCDFLVVDGWERIKMRAKQIRRVIISQDVLIQSERPLHGMGISKYKNKHTAVCL